MSSFQSLLVIALSMIAQACNAASPLVASVTGESETIQSDFVVNPQSASVGIIRIGMTKSELRRLGLPYSVKTEVAEGDEYEIYMVQLSERVTVNANLNLSGVVTEIETSSGHVVDQFGCGTGSTLNELRATYPTGEFVYGTAEGRYATFLTGANIMFRFDPSDLDEECFQIGHQCAVDDEISATMLSIGPVGQ